MRALPIALVLGLAAVGAACSDDDEGTAPPTTVVVPDVTELAPDRSDDGVVKIGVLLPRTGPGASLGEPLIETIDATIRSINEQGGVLDRPVRLVVRDEGVDASTASQAIGDLIDDEGVDAIIGPGASRVALAVTPSIVEAGVLACSPLATTLLLDELPDEGLFVRTIASESIQARAIARSVDGTGFRTVSVVFPDDLYGRTYGAAITAALDDRGLTVVGEHPYSATGEDFEDTAATVLADEPSVVALVGDADNGTRLFATMESAAGTLLPRVVANDSIRDADRATISSLDALALARLSGVSLEPYGGADAIRDLLRLSDDAVPPAFAAAAVDCVNLIALTAEQAGSDSPSAMASLMVSTSRGGTACDSVTECIDLLEQGLDIDYNGPSGLLSLDNDGELTQAEFIDYGFEADGRDVTSERFLISG